MSDRIVVMNAGRIEQVDTPEEIYLHPASVFVADFVGRAGCRPLRWDDWERSLQNRVPQSSLASASMVRPESVRLAAVQEPTQRISGSLGQIITRVFYGETLVAVHGAGMTGTGRFRTESLNLRSPLCLGGRIERLADRPHCRHECRPHRTS